MESNYRETIYCADDDEYKIYCDVCDRLCTERFYKNYLKSGAHISNIRKR